MINAFEQKNLFRCISFCIFIILSVILYTKFDKYYNQNNFAKIILLFILTFNFLTGSLFLNIFKKNLIFTFYFFFILYSINSLLVVFDLINLPENQIKKINKNIGKNFDQRKLIEVILEERKKGNNIFPYVVPREFILKNVSNKIILTPIPNQDYVSCNEYGFWKKIKTDRLGFNNKVTLSNFDTLLVGDSFAEGSCVNQDNEPANLFKNRYNVETYNIGISGNGPLINLALLHELKDKFNFRKIVWIFYDNDFYDLKIEYQNIQLKEYLLKNFDNNNYFLNLKYTNEYQKKYIEENLKSFKKNYSIKENLLELKPLLHIVNKILSFKKNRENNYLIEKNLLIKIFEKVKTLYDNKEIYLVYIPETSCFKSRKIDCEKRAIILKNLVKKKNFINFYETMKNSGQEYKKYYALGIDNFHLSNYGYKYLVDTIYKKIN